MGDVPALPPGLFEFVGRWRPPHPDKVPARIRMGHDLYDRIRTMPPAAGAGPYPLPMFHTGPPPHALIGLDIDLDPDMERGVWQVYAADGTLLRDSRSTNEVT